MLKNSKLNVLKKSRLERMFEFKYSTIVQKNIILFRKMKIKSKIFKFIALLIFFLFINFFLRHLFFSPLFILFFFSFFFFSLFPSFHTVGQNSFLYHCKYTSQPTIFFFFTFRALIAIFNLYSILFHLLSSTVLYFLFLAPYFCLFFSITSSFFLPLFLYLCLFLFFFHLFLFFFLFLNSTSTFMFSFSHLFFSFSFFHFNYFY